MERSIARPDGIGNLLQDLNNYKSNQPSLDRIEVSHQDLLPKKSRTEHHKLLGI